MVIFRRRFRYEPLRRRRFVSQKADANVTLTADPATLTLSGATAVLALTLAASSGSLTLSGGPATTNTTLSASPGTLTLSGSDATLTAEVDVTLTGDPGSLTLTGGTATLTVAAVGKKGGLSKRRFRYVVEIDKQFFEVANIAEAQALLVQARALAEQSAQDDVQRTPEGTSPKPPKIRVKTRAGKPTTSVVLQREVRQTQDAVNRIYAKAAQEIERIREMARAVERRRQQEEDDLLALLL